MLTIIDKTRFVIWTQITKTQFVWSQELILTSSILLSCSQNAFLQCVHSWLLIVSYQRKQKGTFLTPIRCHIYQFSKCKVSKKPDNDTKIHDNRVWLPPLSNQTEIIISCPGQQQHVCHVSTQNMHQIRF